MARHSCFPLSPAARCFRKPASSCFCCVTVHTAGEGELEPAVAVEGVGDAAVAVEATEAREGAVAVLPLPLLLPRSDSPPTVDLPSPAVPDPAPAVAVAPVASRRGCGGAPRSSPGTGVPAAAPFPLLTVVCSRSAYRAQSFVERAPGSPAAARASFTAAATLLHRSLLPPGCLPSALSRALDSTCTHAPTAALPCDAPSPPSLSDLPPRPALPLPPRYCDDKASACLALSSSAADRAAR